MKITVKHFLNKRLNPGSKHERYGGGLISDPTDTEQKKYPLYIKITVNRKTTQVKSDLNDYFATIEEVQKMHSQFINWEQQFIQNSISYELKNNGDKFALKGLNDRIEKYKKPVIQLLNDHLSEKFIKAFENSESEFAGLLILGTISTDLGMLNRAALKLIDGFEDLSKGFISEIKTYEIYKLLFNAEENYQSVTLLDWISGSNRKDSIKKFETVFFSNHEMVQQAITTIDQLVNSELNKL